MFIGEAPGRLGAEATEIPFHGDRTGRNFEELLEFVGLGRAEVYITNAVLCNPKDSAGNNSTPLRSEAHNCSQYLREQIDLIDPVIVVTLGGIALASLSLIEPHVFDLSTHVRTLNRWYNRKLIPLYHPGARALVHRSMANQRSDYQFVADQLRRGAGRTRPVTGITKLRVAAIAKEIVQLRGSLSYFALHKLMYLVECEAWKKFGHGLTDAYFIRQKEGPYCTDLHLAKLRKALPNLVVFGGTSRPQLRLLTTGATTEGQNQLPADLKTVIKDVVAQADHLTDADLKRRVYLTTPMRQILRAERTTMINLYNAPITFGQVTPPTELPLRKTV
jgi:uracil-DNA glycosylase family 4